VRWIFRWREVCESQIANFTPRVRLFQKSQSVFIGDSSELSVGPVGIRSLEVTKVNEYIEHRCAGTTSLDPGECACVPCNFQESGAVATTPLFEDIFVEQHDMFRDLRFAGKLFVFVAAHAGNLRDQCHGRCEMLGR
jgi:hypothetical protein